MSGAVQSMEIRLNRETGLSDIFIAFENGGNIETIRLYGEVCRRDFDGEVDTISLRMIKR